MRLVATIVLITRGVEELHGGLPPEFAAALLAGIGLGLLMLAGLWTPVAGVLVAVLEVGSVVRGFGDPWIHLLLATLGISLALLGPGAWSVDSRLFGWRRVDIDQRDRQGRQ